MRTSLENVNLKRHIQQLNEFLNNTSTEEAMSMFSDIRFYKPSSDIIETFESSTEVIKGAHFRNDSSRFNMLKIVKVVLRSLIIRPFKILLSQSIQDLQEADILFDVLVASKEHAMWGLRYG